MKSYPRVAVFIITFLLGAIALGLINLVTAPPRGLPIELEPPPTMAPVRVHVNGAILNPGVYSLPHNSIVQDAINAAGGITDAATLDNINLASPIKDGQLIYIFRPDEIEPDLLRAVTPNNPNSPRINVNTASSSDLETLPGIGPSLAEKIIEFRQANGPFEDLEDLLAVSGIGPSKLEEIRDYVVVR